jgi:TolA-binding protein
MLLLLSSLAFATPIPNTPTPCSELLLVVNDTSWEFAADSANCGDYSPMANIAELNRHARLLQARTAPPMQRVELLENNLPDGGAGQEARLLLGSALVELQRSEEAKSYLRAILSGPHGAEARWWLCVGAEQRGAIDAAISTYRSLWHRFPNDEFANMAQVRLTELGYPIDDMTVESNRIMALQKARLLVDSYRAPEAVEIYMELEEAAPNDTVEWRHEVAMMLFSAKEYELAVEALNALPRNTENLYHLALGYSRFGDYTNADRIYRELIQASPNSRRADTASYKLGYLQFDSGNLAEAVIEFNAHLQRTPNSRHTDESLWFIGWSQFRLGNYGAANRSFTTLATRYPSSSLAPAAVFWSAKANLRVSDPEAGSSQQFTEDMLGLIDRYPLSGHAWFASLMVDTEFPESPPQQIEHPSPELQDRYSNLQVGMFFSSIGENRWAEERLRGLIGEIESQGREVRLAFASLLQDLGAYQAGQALARPWCGTPQQPGPGAIICWPRPNFETLSEITGAVGLPVNLPYAIMNAESALDPSVTSPAGARGLMQLMPSLGEELHLERFPDRPWSVELLYDPDYNAAMGTTELSRLAERFDTATDPMMTPLVIAGYNGGHPAVSRWLESTEAPIDFAEWSENISYTETRRYVRRVLGYMMALQWIYGS